MKATMSMAGMLVVGACLWLVAPRAEANSIAVTNVALAGNDSVGRTVNVQFDLSWSNSWRTSANWDAAWIFVKFQAPGSNHWEHAVLSTNNPDHTPAVGSEIHAAADGTGAFLYRTDTATGGVNFTRVRLRWNYGTNGYAFMGNNPVNVSVHAIEVVYIPQGAFYLGSGGGETARFFRYSDGSQTTNPYPVLSESPLTISAANGNLYYTDIGRNSSDGQGTLSNAFPKGFGAFYCMKYETTQGQYADFLNKLTGAQWSNRYYNTTANRYTISGPCTNSVASAPDRACNWLNWADGCAYGAWAGLRPMTELEYEKACRGTAPPVPNEYAWGTAGVTQLVTEAGGIGTGTETSGTAGADLNYNNYASGVLNGPTRVGLFATTNSGRSAAGAGYYGVMELSGNVCELCILVRKPEGRAFLGTHGSGLLDASGNATNADWYWPSAYGAAEEQPANPGELHTESWPRGPAAAYRVCLHILRHGGTRPPLFRESALACPGRVLSPVR